MDRATLVRIVRLTFNEETISEFEDLYAEHSPAIALRKGCLGVELVTDLRNPYVRATISRWEDEESLNEYRKSELFGVVWPATKNLFTARPEVWSYLLPEG
jgi:quinol monooxygenase YgiN|tara:strand:+ start:495 stop:797 length:303 start_codon:yes stop_codon:yes gene_type:complete